MKKSIILTSITAILLMNNVMAQDSNDSRIKAQFGLKVGGNYSNVYDTDGEEFKNDPKFGLAAGAFVVIPISEILGVQAEALFSQKGFKATGMLLGSNYEITRTTNHLDFPIMISLKPTPNLTLLAGPQYSYMLKVTNKFENASTTIEQEQEFDNDNIRKNTLGLLVGADINIEHLVVGGRIGWDLTQNNGDGTSTTPRYKNAYYQVTLGYRFFND